MPENIKPTREQLAKIFNDQRLIKAFEEIFDLIPSGFEISSFESSSALYSSIQSNDSLSALTTIVDFFSKGTEFSIPNSLTLDSINFNLNSVGYKTVGQMGYLNDEDTIYIQHKNGVLEPIGLALYIQGLNNTGSTILKGSGVGFVSVTSPGIIDIAKYIADGSFINSFIGITSEDIDDGESGRVSVWGIVSEVDTSSFLIGDVLYASTMAAGDFTNVKPSPPNLSIPVAIVLQSAVSGMIFSRPIIQQQTYYGLFLKTSTDTPATPNTAFPIEMDSFTISYGINIDLGNPERIIVDNTGLYSIDVDFQISTSTSALKNIWVWIAVNGVNITNSSRIHSIQTANERVCISRNWLLSLDENDYIELRWATSDTNVALQNIAGTGFAPASPSVVLKINMLP